MLAAFLIAAAFAAQDVTLQTSDGVKLHAVAERVPQAKKGVVLVHMLGRSAGDWSYLSEKLARSDLAVIAPDLRGHGDNPEPEDDLEPEDYAAMLLDVQAAVSWLQEQGVTEVSCAGASIGANLCLRAAAADANIVNVVMLSPGLNYKGVTSGDVIGDYGTRPVLLVASEDDSYAMKSAQLLEERAKGQRHLEVLEAAGHGTKMLNRDPGLEGLVMSWLLGTYRLSSGEIVTPAPAVQIDPGSIETTGTKLDSHR